MNTRGTIQRTRGFTMLELMVAIFVSIMIIGALFQVFNRVQSMFRAGHNQTKVLERGRAIMDMIVRDLEMMRAADLGPTYENLNARDFGVEFWQDGMDYRVGNVVFNEVDRTYRVLDPEGWRLLQAGEFSTLLPYNHPILPSEQFYSGDFFFLGRDRDWHAYGYGLYSTEGARVPNQVAGSLYRYHEAVERSAIPDTIRHHNSRAGNLLYQKVADGVVHLRLRAISAQDPGRAPWHEPIFKGSFVPLYVEVEFGLLEDTVVLELEAKAEEFAPRSPDRYPALMKILEANLDKVHMFRQLVPIRNSRYFGFGPSKAAMTDLMIFRTRGINTRIEGQGDRFAFIIDRSGSMASDNRLAHAQQALSRTLEKMEPDKKFFVYFFDHETEPMEFGDMLEATPANVNEVLPWIQGKTPRGSTNPRGALQETFDNLNPHTIWLLTDGTFSSSSISAGADGNIVSTPLGPVPELIKKLNKGRGVRVNTIGFARQESEVDPGLKAIAEQNGGTYTFIESKTD